MPPASGALVRLPVLASPNQQVPPHRHHAFFSCESVGYVRRGVGDLALLASLCICCSCRRPPACGSRVLGRGSSCQDSRRWEDASCSHEVSGGPKCQGQRYRTGGKASGRWDAPVLWTLCFMLMPTAAHNQHVCHDHARGTFCFETSLWANLHIVES